MENKVRHLTIAPAKHGGFVVMEAWSDPTRIALLYGGGLNACLQFMWEQLVVPGGSDRGPWGAPAAPRKKEAGETAKERRNREDADRQREHEERMKISEKVLEGLKHKEGPSAPAAQA